MKIQIQQHDLTLIKDFPETEDHDPSSEEALAAAIQLLELVYSEESIQKAARSLKVEGGM